MTLELTGARELALQFTQNAERVTPAAIAGMRDATEFLLQAIIADFLNGQALERRTGQLQDAMEAGVESLGADVIGTVRVDPSSPAARYGAVHEFGGTYAIPEHLRTSSLGKEFSVAAHSATFPERSFLRAALQSLEDPIFEIFANRFYQELRA